MTCNDLVHVLLFLSFQVGLLDDLSGDEDDFLALSRDRASSKGDDPTSAPGNADFFSSPNKKAQQTADLLGADFGGPKPSGKAVLSITYNEILSV